MFSSINNLLFYVFDPIKKITWYFDNKKITICCGIKYLKDQKLLKFCIGTSNKNQNIYMDQKVI
jgi:hypothetical protein